MEQYHKSQTFVLSLNMQNLDHYMIIWLHWK